MLWYPKTISDIEHGPMTLQQSVNSILQKAPDKILYSEKFYTTDNPKELNISNLQTLLIQITGRFCEKYASDLLCTLSTIEPFCKNVKIDKPDRWIIGIGIRDYGIDHNAFIIHRLNNTKSGNYEFVYPTQVYRKLLILDITDKIIDMKNDIITSERIFTLVDATHDVSKIIPNDLQST